MTEEGSDATCAAWPVDSEVDVAFRALWRHLVVADPTGPSDAIFCFGSRDRAVPARAAELHAAGVAPLVMVSGGGLIDGHRTEADVFAEDLVARGVPPEQIVRERESRNTGENVTFGVRGLEVHVRLRRITAVSWPLVARRCRATVARHHPTVTVASAPALAHPDEVWAATPRTVRAALGEWDRLGTYVARGFTVAQPRPPEVRTAVRTLRRALADAATAPLVAVGGRDALTASGVGSRPVPHAGASAPAAFR